MSDPKQNSAREMVESLKNLRDRARIQAHLFSLDAKDRWGAIETSLGELEARLEASGEKLAARATETFRDVTLAAKDLMRELDGSLELATPVARVMKSAPYVCGPNDGLDRAAQLMWEADCGAIPVVDATGSPLGIVTDRDACMAAYTSGRALAQIPVSIAMAKTPITCAPDDSLGHAARLMANGQVRRLLVVEKGRLVGLLALADIAREVRRFQGNALPSCVALAHALAAISEPRAAPPSAE